METIIISSYEDVNNIVVAPNYDTEKVNVITSDILEKWDTFDKDKINQIKLKYDFSIEFANNRLTLTNAAFFVLDKLTIFADVDYSINIELESFRKFINMSEVTFARTIQQLKEKKYIVWKEAYCKYFFTGKTHTVVSSTKRFEVAKVNKEQYYIPTLPITNWTEFNKLSAVQQRFLYHLLNRQVKVSGSLISMNIELLLHARQRNKTNYHYTEMRNLTDMLLAFEQFHKLGLFSVKVIANTYNKDTFNWATTGDTDNFELPTVLNEMETDHKLNFVSIEIKQLFKSGGLSNVNTYYTLESLLANYNPLNYMDYSLLDFPRIMNIFKTNALEANHLVELHSIFTLKKMLVNNISIENRALIVNLFEVSLAEFIDTEYNALPHLVKVKFAFYNKFKDFYFLPKLMDLINDIVKISLSERKSIGVFSSPVFKAVLTKSDLQLILKFYAAYANINRLLSLRYNLANIVADFSSSEEDKEQKMLYLEEILSEGFEAVNTVTETKLRERYHDMISKHELNLSFESFVNVTTYVSAKMGTLEEELILKYYKRAEAAINENIEVELISNDMLTHKNKIFTNAKRFPHRLLADLIRVGVTEKAFNYCLGSVETYYEELINSIQFIKHPVQLNTVDMKLVENPPNETYHHIILKLSNNEALTDNENLIYKNELASIEKYKAENPALYNVDYKQVLAQDILFDEQRIEKAQTRLHKHLLQIAQTDRLNLEKRAGHDLMAIEDELIKFEVEFNKKFNAIAFNKGLRNTVYSEIVEGFKEYNDIYSN